MSDKDFTWSRRLAVDGGWERYWCDTGVPMTEREDSLARAIEKLRDEADDLHYEMMEQAEMRENDT
jgi:hypothetical protein